MGPLGWQETVFIFILALLVFGPRKLPELGKTVAKAMGEFRRASSELKATWDREMKDIEREQESLREVTQSYQNEISNYTYNYEDSYNSEYYDSGAYGTESADTNPSDSTTVSAAASEGAETPATVPQNGDAPEQAIETASADQPVTVPDDAVPEGAADVPERNPVNDRHA
jgi:TatA/E family protein of Tat protein translocase